MSWNRDRHDSCIHEGASYFSHTHPKTCVDAVSIYCLRQVRAMGTKHFFLLAFIHVHVLRLVPSLRVVWNSSGNAY
jgi:hypothetical protein